MATSLEFTPVRAPRGERVHATSLRSPGRTLCGLECNGWTVASTKMRVEGWTVVAAELDCPRCKNALERRRR